MSSPSPGSALSSSYHGKARVRVAKVTRHPSGEHRFTELRVSVHLFGGSSRSFTHGDNSHVVSTDTCKNHVYLLAKTHPCDTPDAFALALVDRLLAAYPSLSAAHAAVEERPWRRARVAARPHAHAFELAADGTRHARAQLARGPGGALSATLSAGLHSLSVLKTTQSGWEGFVQDACTTLAETRERVLATTVDARWTFRARATDALRALPFAEVHARAREGMLAAFYGPPQRGRYSPGVQKTLYEMADAVCKAVADVECVSVALPNLHFLPCRIPVFEKNGIQFEDDVYIPTDEPHGVIQATVDNVRPAKI